MINSAASVMQNTKEKDKKYVIKFKSISPFLPMSHRPIP